MCVQWCLADALIYEEREEEVEEEAEPWRRWRSGWRRWPTSTAGRRSSTPSTRMSKKPEPGGLVSTVETVSPLRGDHRGDQGGRRRGLQVLLSVREVRRRLPLEPGDGLQHPQDHPAGRLRPARDRARGHLALHDLRHLPVAVPPGRRADRGRGRPAPDRHGLRRLPRLRAARCAPPAAASPARQSPERGAGQAGRLGERSVREAVRRGDGDPLLRRLLLQLRPADCRRWRWPRPRSSSKAGVDFGILGTRESCCGESIRKTGDEEVFKTLAKENIKTFIDHGVKRILVSSPHCYHTFKNEYPEFMVNFEVVHISQFLAELIEAGTARAHRASSRRGSPITTPATWGGTTASTTSPGRS